MQHRQCTQPALPGVTTVVAPRECQHPLTECSLLSNVKFRKKQKFLQRDENGWVVDQISAVYHDAADTDPQTDVSVL